MIDYILLIIGFIGLVVATITDFQKREVADWLNYGLICAGLGILLIHAILKQDYSRFIIAVCAVAILYIFGIIMFYTGQWGGGDSKMLMGLAALFATTRPLFKLNPANPDIISQLFELNTAYNISFMLHFMINALFVGGIYGIIWTIGLSIWKKDAFKKTFKQEYQKYKKYVLLAGILGLAGLLASPLLEGPLIFLNISLMVLIITMPWLFIYTKTVEIACMVRPMKIKHLTEGEWIEEDVIVDKELICGPKDLGIKYEQIQKLKKLEKEGKISEVIVKIGIPFVPAFFIAFIITLTLGNIFLVFLL